MKKNILSTASALALIAGLSAGPALADVFVHATITKDKDVKVWETITQQKWATVAVNFNQRIDGAAEAQSIVNVSNSGNEVERSPRGDGVTDFDIRRTARITTSINSNSGIVGVNQDVGNMVNQSNVVSFAFDASGSAFTNSQAEMSQDITKNKVTELERFDPSVVNRSATLTLSVDNNIGIVGVNQNAGNMNNQTNTLAVAVGAGAVYALSEAALGQVNSGNSVQEVNTNKFDLIDGSVNTNRGVVQVNQSSGNMNNQGSAISIAALTSRVTSGRPTP